MSYICMYVYMTVSHREGKALAAEKEEAAGGIKEVCELYLFETSSYIQWTYCSKKFVKQINA